MDDYIQHELRPLVDRLRARYPGVRVFDAHISTTYDGMRQQNVRYQAPLVELKRAGLLTAEMLRHSKHGLGETALGDGFSLTEGWDCKSVSGCHDLEIWTGEYPRERSRIAVTEAKRLLRRISKAVTRAAKTGTA